MNHGIFPANGKWLTSLIEIVNQFDMSSPFYFPFLAQHRGCCYPLTTSCDFPQRNPGHLPVTPASHAAVMPESPGCEARMAAASWAQRKASYPPWSLLEGFPPFAHCFAFKTLEEHSLLSTISWKSIGHLNSQEALPHLALALSCNRLQPSLCLPHLSRFHPLAMHHSTSSRTELRSL